MRDLWPFLVQGALMGFDEFYCHRGRVLRRWERVGHPIDTAAFLLCLLFLLACAPTPASRLVFLGLAVANCLVISKDEWEHRNLSSGFENWLHALLFMLHPVLLIWAGWLWWQGRAQPTLIVAAVLVAGFLVYQTVYWNFWRHDRQ